jgi:NTP pyrophosphatase (non-canonical NTP hydrolase)
MYSTYPTIKRETAATTEARAGASQPAFQQLTFDSFRAANVARCLKWHPEGIESWSPSDWLTAVTGELGELASLLKMRNRERDGLPGNKFSPTDKQIADELADVLTYLDLVAAALGVDLGRAAAEKFNEISIRVGFPDRIELAAHAPGQTDAPGHALVPIEPPPALAPLLTGYSVAAGCLSERDQSVIEQRLRDRWAAILAVISAESAGSACVLEGTHRTTIGAIGQP